MRCSRSYRFRLSSSVVYLARSAHLSACFRRNFAEAIAALKNLGDCIAALPILQCNKDFIDVHGFPLERLHPKLTWLWKWRVRTDLCKYEHVPLQRPHQDQACRARFSASYEGIKPRCALMPHVSNDMIARRNFGTPEQQTTSCNQVR